MPLKMTKQKAVEELRSALDATFEMYKKASADLATAEASAKKAAEDIARERASHERYKLLYEQARDSAWKASDERAKRDGEEDKERETIRLGIARQYDLFAELRFALDDVRGAADDAARGKALDAIATKLAAARRDAAPLIGLKVLEPHSITISPWIAMTATGVISMAALLYSVVRDAAKSEGAKAAP